MSAGGMQVGDDVDGGTECSYAGSIIRNHRAYERDFAKHLISAVPENLNDLEIHSVARENNKKFIIKWSEGARARQYGMPYNGWWMLI